MKKLLSAVLIAISFVTLTFGTPALATGDAAAGAGIFGANCAACHIGGGNSVNPAKTLKTEDLETNGKNSEEAVITQVTNGAGAMPAFGKTGALKPQQIEDVAAYVIAQAAAGWK